MKQSMRRIGAFTIMAFALTSCGSNDFRTDGIEAVTVSESDGFYRFQTGDLITFDEPKAIQVFEDMLREAERIPGIANVVGPEYDLEVRFEDEETDRYYLWLNELDGESSLYDADDTDTAYLIPVDVTNRLIELLEAD
ncbi:Uncharacterised protein [Exiguobacterium aurantiacum]|uniref:YhfM-like domain-containing protein n=2 Tax=Exiguobacterium aurantiacum TaxID=33987 RepID=A0A377FTR4_9BACL|nr:hypothetical protein [Exiguobacterium aurantiacum]STO08207.1 Uncharacterised protein [Exiguobacterium aurantiacum]